MSYDKNTKEYEGYIYIITNTINDNVYIGQTITDIKNRWRQHKYDCRHSKSNTSTVLYKAMNKYGIDNFNIQILDSVKAKNKEELHNSLNDLEIYYIKKYNCIAPNGYNILLGGQNPPNNSHSVTSYFADGSFDKEFKSMRDAADCLGINNTNSIFECCNGIIEYSHGRVWRYKGDNFDKYPVYSSQDKMDNMKNVSTKVVQYDKQTKQILNKFNSIKEACLFVGYKYPEESYKIRTMCAGLTTSDISDFVWRYDGDDFDKYRHHNAKKKPVFQIDLTTNDIIKMFESAADAGRSFNAKSYSSITECCKGTRNKAFGYGWVYASDPTQPDKTKIIS